MEKKSCAEIEESINRVRRLGKRGEIFAGGILQSVLKALKMFAKDKKARSEIEETVNQARPTGGIDNVVEASIQRVLKAYGK
jgi:signal transduction protein with GAF and PtsI domain